MRRLSFIFSLLFLFCLSFGFSNLTSQINAQNERYTKAQFEQECIRRNLLWDCSCDCSKDWGTSSTQDEFRMCEQSNLSINNCSSSNFQRIIFTDGQDRSTAVLSNDSSSSFNFFPVVGQNGLLRVDPNNDTIDLAASVRNILLWALYFLGVIAIFFVLYGGFLITTAGANEERSGNGSRMMRNALLGIIISIAGIFLVVGISTALGVDTQQINFNENLENINEDQTDDNFTFEDIQ